MHIERLICILDRYGQGDYNIEKIIRETIRECLKDVPIIKAVEEPIEEISEDENTLMDSLDLFM